MNDDPKCNMEEGEEKGRGWREKGGTKGKVERENERRRRRRNHGERYMKKVK